MADLTAWYTSTEDDVLPNVVREFRRGPSALFTDLALVAGVLLLMDAFTSLFGIDRVVMALFGLGFVVVAGFRWFIAPRRFARRQLASPEFRARLGTRGVRITDAGMSWADPITSSSITWAGVSRVELERDGVRLHLGLHGGAVRVPSRAFASVDGMHEFFNLAQSLLAQTREQSVGPAVDARTPVAQAPRASDALPAEASSKPPKHRHTLGWVLIGLVVLAVVVVGAASFVVPSIPGGLAQSANQQFGDQNMKTAVALIELYKVRHGAYPARLSDIDFLGTWDVGEIDRVRYVVSADRKHYYVEVAIGWNAKPSLSYPPAFWQGTGYDPSLATAH